MILISDIYFVGHAYYCLSIWHSYYCPVDFIVNDKPLSQIDLIWYSVTGALFVNVIRHLPIALVAFAPAYLVASYVSRRRRIRHNLAGIIFWIVAWTMPCFVLLLVVGGNIWASGYPVFRYEDILAMFLFLMPGVCCGVVYCLLTFGAVP